jgi:hypothetical protein
MTPLQQTLVSELTARFNDTTDFKLSMLLTVAKSIDIPAGEVYRLVKDAPKKSRGIYNLQAVLLPFPEQQYNEQAITSDMQPPKKLQSILNDSVFVPPTDSYFVSWGNYKTIETIVGCNFFYPTYITGMSGNGKTVMVEQACAKLKRSYIRVQITPETDEDDLIGGFRLIDGETVFNKGPVIKAMETGAVLLIDEIDRGSSKIMCLQGVLEGKPVLIKKTGEMVSPSVGFNIIATANTKGKGSEDGRFVTANIIDEAFLERFVVTIEQPYPTMATEKKIILNHMKKFDCLDETFATLLATWSDTIRKTFEDGGLDELISTRRICHIIQTFAIFKSRSKAIELCVNRFDTDTREAFIDLYSKVDASVVTSNENAISGTEASQVILDEILGSA